MSRLFVAVLLVAGGAMACRPAAERTPQGPELRAAEAADSALVAPARVVADALGKDLATLLFSQLDAGGPDLAIAVCADSAQVRSSRLYDRGAYVRRVSLQVRNPANRPDSMETAVLERFAALHSEGRLPAEEAWLVPGEEGVTGVDYFRPIVMQERCLTCHGNPATFAPGVRRVLAERYPADQATGYRAGDLRGMISVRVVVPPAR